MSYIPKAICTKCNQGLKPERNGVICHMYDEKRRWFFSVMADLWKCPECGIEIVVGFGKSPIVFNHQRAKPPLDPRPEYNINVYDY